MAQTKTATIASASTNYFSAANHADFNITGDISIEMWVKFTTLPGSGNEFTMMSKYNDATSNRQWRVTVFNNTGTYTLRLITSTSGTGFTEGSVNFTTTPTTGQWYHLAWTKSGTTFTAYVDAVSQGTATVDSSQFNGTANFTIGAYDDGTATIGNKFNGTMGLVRLWSVTRTQAQIAANRWALIGSTTNLKGEWSLDNTVADNSGNSHTLTNNNSTAFGTAVPGGLDGGIGFDMSAKDAGSGATTRTFSHTIQQLGEILIVGVFSNQVSNPITGVTYGGVALTAIGSWQSGAGAGGLQFYYLLNPAVGTANVVVTQTGTNYLLGASASYVNAKQSGQPDSVGGGTVTSNATITATTTIVGSGCWLITMATSSGGTGYTFSVQMRQSTSDPFGFQDSNGTVAAGSQSQTFTDSLSAAQSPWQAISIAPAPAATLAARSLIAKQAVMRAASW